MKNLNSIFIKKENIRGIKAKILLFVKVKESTYSVLQLHNIDNCVLTYEITFKSEIFESTYVL